MVCQGSWEVSSRRQHGGERGKPRPGGGRDPGGRRAPGGHRSRDGGRLRLPDFRGDSGFWKAYPAYERLGLSFVDAANPDHFDEDPAFGWGFYGHRLHLYRETIPHDGYHILRTWMDELGLPGFAVTSNVDGQLQKAGFDPAAVHEVHGPSTTSSAPCRAARRSGVPGGGAGGRRDHARRAPARCRNCRRVARPNILMFGDGAWLPGRSSAQARRLEAFLEAHGEKGLVVVELGAGTAVATIRHLSSGWGAGPARP